MVLGITSECAKMLVIESISATDMIAVEAVVSLVAADEEKGGPARIEGVEDTDGRACLDSKLSHVGMSGVAHFGAVGKREVNAALSENLDDVQARVAVGTIQGVPPVAKHRGESNADGHVARRIRKAGDGRSRRRL